MDRHARREIEDLEERLSAAESRGGSGMDYALLEKHTGQIKWLVGQVDALNATVEALQKRIEELEMLS